MGVCAQRGRHVAYQFGRGQIVTIGNEQRTTGCGWMMDAGGDEVEQVAQTHQGAVVVDVGERERPSPLHGLDQRLEVGANTRSVYQGWADDHQLQARSLGDAGQCLLRLEFGASVGVLRPGLALSVKWLVGGRVFPQDFDGAQKNQAPHTEGGCGFGQSHGPQAVDLSERLKRVDLGLGHHMHAGGAMDDTVDAGQRVIPGGVGTDIAHHHIGVLGAP